VRVDGNDLFAVIKVTRDAIARATAPGGGPTLIEALTARMPPREGAGEWRRRDPVARVRRWLEGRGLWSDVKQREHEEWVLGEIDAAIEEAEKSGPPALSSMFDDVYGAPPRELEEQRAALLAAPRATGLAKPQ
jgi:2-oxoisovalerate dehydrogenase E1 component alpha subunit